MLLKEQKQDEKREQQRLQKYLMSVQRARPKESSLPEPKKYPEAGEEWWKDLVLGLVQLRQRKKLVPREKHSRLKNDLQKLKWIPQIK